MMELNGRMYVKGTLAQPGLRRVNVPLRLPEWQVQGPLCATKFN